MEILHDEENFLYEPCASCKHRYVDDLFNEDQCDQKTCVSPDLYAVMQSAMDCKNELYRMRGNMMAKVTEISKAMEQNRKAIDAAEELCDKIDEKLEEIIKNREVEHVESVSEEIVEPEESTDRDFICDICGKQHVCIPNSTQLALYKKVEGTRTTRTCVELRRFKCDHCGYEWYMVEDLQKIQKE